METILTLISVLSLVAFVVGMFSPKTVKCSSRGKVALIFVSTFFISTLIAGSLAENTNAPRVETTDMEHGQSQDSLAGKESQIQEKSSKEPTVGTQVQIGNFAYIVNDFSFRKSVGDEFMRETADGIYLLVDLSLVNVDDESHTLDGSLFSITDLNGRKYEYSTNGSTALEMSGYKTLFLKQCQPNIPTRGVLIFEVPKKDKYYIHLAGGFWSSKSIRVLLSK